jgi:uncharacterized membrane protein YdbT with pleckstrin-like domain
MVITAVAASAFFESAGIIAAIGAILMLFPMATMIRDILNWMNLQYIVTSRRVVQVNGVINKNVIDSSLEKVNDVHMSQSVMGRLFNYGDVEILTASELGANLFRRIQDPIRFKTTMLNAKENMETDSDGRAVRVKSSEDIPALIASLERLRQEGILTEEEFDQKKKDLLARI